MRDMVRAALFNILRELIPGSRFLDLFAGTGSVGIEALSRGAQHATFADSAPQAVRLIRNNLNRLGLTGQAELYEMDVLQAIARFDRQGCRFDLIFIGPPYGRRLAGRTLHRLTRTRILAEGGVVTAEIFKKEHLEERYGDLRRFDERVYGDNQLIFYGREEQQEVDA